MCVMCLEIRLVVCVVLQLAGLGLVVIGIWFLVDDKVLNFLHISVNHGTMQVSWAAAIVVLVVGLITALIGLAGCWGACREKTSCLNLVSRFFILLTSLNFLD